MTRSSTLLASHEARLQRQLQKRRAVLRFLREHLWSTQETLGDVMLVRARQPANRFLSKLVGEGVIRRHTVDALGGRVVVWGITPAGQAEAFDPQTETPVTAYFEPSRVSEQTIHHHLQLQRLRLSAEAAGWANWQDGNRMTGNSKDSKRPDAVAFDPHGRKVAIELERTMKTSRRYAAILAFYLRALKTETFDRVVWVSPTPDFCARLRAIIKRIDHVRVSGQRLAVDPARHFTNIFFADFASWPHI